MKFVYYGACVLNILMAGVSIILGNAELLILNTCSFALCYIGYVREEKNDL